ncbi:MAG: hypothetical protein EOM36_00250 [Bacteroidia bacterium]|nr:hypothetical protein [Bacteroidia bacterium]
MNKPVISLFCFMIVTAGVFGQTDRNGLPAASTQPKANIKVNKEYDKNGNLIRYDSTYTYVFTGTDSLAKDSFLKEFEQRFDAFFPSSRSLFFNDFFVNDSSMIRYYQYMKKLDKLYKEIDSVRHEYFYEQYNKKR